MNVEKYISIYQKRNNPGDRYASFDYCYHYYKSKESKDILSDLEKSCLVLGFYLASWGMFRGKSFLLREKSILHFEKVVQYIAKLDKEVWKIDVDGYTPSNIKTIINIYREIKIRVVDNNASHLILVTKIMLGVFGIVPAFDRFFCLAMKNEFDGRCKFASFNVNSLMFIGSFYESNRDAIDKYVDEIKVRAFDKNVDTGLHYTKAKIIDMYGFSKGVEIAEEKKRKAQVKGMTS